jgi:hypothetical protein
MIDKVDYRIGCAIVMAFWSVVSMAHELATSAFGFGVAQLVK